MPTEWLKQCAKRWFNLFGLEVCWKQQSGGPLGPRTSMAEVLQQAKRVGFAPGTVIDVGAALGSFTRECHAVFPEAHYLLLEPLEEYRPLLEQLVRGISKAHCCIAAAASRSGTMEINVHPDLVGSSLYREVEQCTDVNGIPRPVSVVALDSMVDERGAVGPYLMKLDVQGAELDVLRGAERVLADCEFVVLEVSFFQFFHDGPECADVFAYMRGLGFVPYDIVGLQYRPLDQALSQADIAFVKEEGLFRRHHYYATPAQRAEQNARMKQHLSELFGDRAYDS
ncbi:MAG: FkbM family methyltransferase [Nitrospira sp.]|nr:FkbM family methyltransferase [Nitrospira sp.]MDH4302486.1 FkbM family methyltransferase [Nitrospira sp.]MDH5192228.1 FkbM family methyltransferase [Nitrospira sp.]